VTNQRWKDFLETFAVHVSVPVDQPRHHGAPLQVDDSRVRIDHRQRRRVGADVRDPVTRYRQRLGNRKPRIDGDDLAAIEHDICCA